jgi:hypothetical protein
MCDAYEYCDQFIEEARRDLLDAKRKYTIPLAFELADALIEVGYDEEVVEEFYQLFQTLALPCAPPAHWDQIDRRMQRILGIKETPDPEEAPTVKPFNSPKLRLAHRA